ALAPWFDAQIRTCDAVRHAGRHGARTKSCDGAGIGVPPGRVGLLCRRGRGHSGSVVDAKTTEARQLHRRMAQIEARDQAKKIDLDALDPSDLGANETPQ